MNTTATAPIDTYGYVLADGTAYVSAFDPFTALDRVTADRGVSNDAPFGLLATEVNSDGVLGDVFLFGRDLYGADARIALPLTVVAGYRNDRCTECGAHIAEPHSPACSQADPDLDGPV